jgi:hypothetical protein
VPRNQAHRPEIGQDLVFQRYSWRAQRFGWALLIVLMAAGLAGLLGPGPLSNVSARDGKDLAIEYERFVRHGSKTEIRVRVEPSQPGPVRIAITRAYLGQSRLQQTVPEPVSVQASGTDAIFTFDVEINSPLQATFVMEPGEIGTHTARIATADGSSVTLRQFTYP